MLPVKKFDLEGRAPGAMSRPCPWRCDGLGVGRCSVEEDFGGSHACEPLMGAVIGVVVEAEPDSVLELVLNEWAEAFQEEQFFDGSVPAQWELVPSQHAMKTNGIYAI